MEIIKCFFRNKRSLFIAVFGICFLVFGFWIIKASNVEAISDKGDYLKIMLDIGDEEIYEGYFPSSGNVGNFNVSATSYTYDANKQCAIFISEEDPICNDDYIVWVKKGTIIGTNSGSLFDDIGVANYSTCCTNTDNACSKNSGTACGDRCNWSAPSTETYGAVDVFEQDVVTGWTNQCSTNCSIYSGSGSNYEFKEEYLCNNTWKACDSDGCETIGSDNYACKNNVWEKCSGSCSSGNCIGVSPPATSPTLSPTLTSTLTGWHLPANHGLIDDFGTVVFNLTSWLLGFVVMIAVLALIWGGLNYVGSSGDSEKAKTAKDVVKYTLMGLVVAGLAYAIVNIIVTLIP